MLLVLRLNIVGDEYITYITASSSNTDPLQVLCSGLYKVYPTNLELSTLLLYISSYGPLVITTTTTTLHIDGRKVIKDRLL